MLLNKDLCFKDVKYLETGFEKQIKENIFSFEQARFYLHRRIYIVLVYS